MVYIYQFSRIYGISMVYLPGAGMNLPTWLGDYERANVDKCSSTMEHIAYR